MDVAPPNGSAHVIWETSGLLRRATITQLLALGGSSALTKTVLDDFFDDELTSISGSGIDYNSDYFMVQDVIQLD